MKEVNRGMNVVKMLKQIMDSIKQNIEQEFKELNLTGTQGMLMGTLAHGGEMKISDLSEHMGLSNSTVSGIVDRLEKQGFLERRRSKEDRRVVYVTVTSEFKKKAKNHFDRVEKKVNDIINEATQQEVDKIYEGLDILKELMERQNQ